MKTKYEISVIIVHYQLIEKLIACLESIYKNTKDISFEVLIFDNDEEKALDETLFNKYKNLGYIGSPKNFGYGKAINRASSRAKGKYLFIVNPDTLVVDGALNKLSSFLDKNENAAVVAPLLLDPKGNVYERQGNRILTPMKAIFSLSFIDKIWKDNSVSREYWLENWDKTTSTKVDVVPGTAFMIRRKIFNQIKGFDENFFLYFEEFDLCKRIHDLGYEQYIQPEAKLIHYWGASTKNVDKKYISRIFKKSRFYYFKKHYGLIKAVIVELFLRLSKKILLLLFLVILLSLLFFSKR
jgi:N-acetylglucosaminyl-diphospho-decaprenol L-rhamnosyltransferase